MDEYISKQAFKEKYLCCGWLPEISEEEFDTFPAADVVEVVRCDYCERRYEEDGEYFCSRTDMPCADDDFCSHGARMDKEDEM